MAWEANFVAKSVEKSLLCVMNVPMSKCVIQDTESNGLYSSNLHQCKECKGYFFFKEHEVEHQKFHIINFSDWNCPCGQKYSRLYELERHKVNKFSHSILHNVHFETLENFC